MDIIFLGDFSVIKPDFGLIFWTTIIFALFWFIIGKFAFKPIAKALKERESEIQGALDEAKKAREEMANMRSQNEDLMRKANEERMNILREAKEAKAAIVNDAKDIARKEAKKIATNAMQEIENQKKAALIEVKNKAGLLALQIAEKVLRKQLQGDKSQEDYVNTLVNEIELN